MREVLTDSARRLSELLRSLGKRAGYGNIAGALNITEVNARQMASKPPTQWAAVRDFLRAADASDEEIALGKQLLIDGALAKAGIDKASLLSLPPAEALESAAAAAFQAGDVMEAMRLRWNARAQYKHGSAEWFLAGDGIADYARTGLLLSMAAEITRELREAADASGETIWQITARHNEALNGRLAHPDRPPTRLYDEIEQLILEVAPDPLKSQAWSPEWVKSKRDRITAAFGTFMENPALPSGDWGRIGLDYISAINNAADGGNWMNRNEEVAARLHIVQSKPDEALALLDGVQNIRIDAPLSERGKEARTRCWALARYSPQEALELALQWLELCRENRLGHLARDFSKLIHYLNNIRS